MTRTRFILSIGAVAIVALSWAARSDAVGVVTCTDNGLTYSTSCPADPTTNNRCIVPAGTLSGCCNKGTCSGAVCDLTNPGGSAQDAGCLNDGNQCTNDACTRLSNNQASCTHQPAPSTQDCNLDSNVCTIDKCNGSSSDPQCVSTGNVNTCAAEQAQDPAEQPICRPWKCDATNGCAKTGVDNDPPVPCDDGKDCTSGDICINAVCAKGPSGTIVHDGYPCRDDDTTLANDSRTWCKAGTCNGMDEGCKNVNNVANGAPCDPNPCTNSTCNGSGANGTCVINSCNTGQSVFCEPCGATFDCINYGAGQNANIANPCGCLSLF